MSQQMHNGLPVFESQYARHTAAKLGVPVVLKQVRDDGYWRVVGYVEAIDKTTKKLEPWTDYDPIMEDMDSRRASKRAQGLWLHAGD